MVPRRMTRQNDLLTRLFGAPRAGDPWGSSLFVSHVSSRFVLPASLALEPVPVLIGPQQQFQDLG